MASVCLMFIEPDLQQIYKMYQKVTFFQGLIRSRSLKFCRAFSIVCWISWFSSCWLLSVMASVCLMFTDPDLQQIFKMYQNV